MTTYEATRAAANLVSRTFFTREIEVDIMRPIVVRHGDMPPGVDIEFTDAERSSFVFEQIEMSAQENAVAQFRRSKTV